MRDLDKLLLSAFPQELTDTPPAPVEKRRIKEQTFQKLNLELSGGAASVAGEQWAVPVAKKRRPWAVLAACLALAVVAGLGVALRPLLVPGVAPLTQGTYLNLEVTETHFRQETGELVFTLEATTDLSLNAQTKSQSYGWWVGASFSTHVGNTILRGGQEALTKLTHWQQVGEDTYRCEGFALELLSQTRSEQELYGEQEGVFSMEVTDSSGKTLNASAPFAVELPPDGPTATFETSYPVGTYLEGSVANASFDREQWAVILNLHAQTDMELSDPSAETRYQWEYRLVFHTSQGDQQVAGSQDLFHDSQPRWKTGGDYYETTMTIPVDPEFLREKNLVGSQEGTLYLQVTDNSAGEEDPPQFSVDLDFSMTLPWSATQLTSGTEQVEPYFACEMAASSFDREQWALILNLHAQTTLMLSDPIVSKQYQWEYRLVLHTPEGDQQVASFQDSSPENQPHWATGGDYYESILTIPLDPENQREQNLVGSLDATLFLQVTDDSAGEEEQSEFPVEMNFPVVLPSTTQLTSGTEPSLP